MIVSSPELIYGDVRSRNLALMWAYSIHKKQLCPKCGYPRDVCRSQQAFSAQQAVCYATKVVEEAQAEASKSKAPQHGIMWMPEYQEVPLEQAAAKPPQGMFGT